MKRLLWSQHEPNVYIVFVPHAWAIILFQRTDRIPRLCIPPWLSKYTRSLTTVLSWRPGHTHTRARRGLGPTPPHAVADHREAALQGDELPMEEEAVETDTESTQEDPYWSYSVVFSVHAQPAEGHVNTFSQRVARRNVANIAHFNVESCSPSTS